MKKLKLSVDDLEVTSFAAEKETGAVYANQVTYVSRCATQCLDCTEAEGCYPSLYCTGPQGCVATYREGCVTDNYAAC